MSSTPELKAKKIARDAALQKKATAAAAEKVKSDAALTQDITARAKKYEEEYSSLEKAAIDNRRNAKANNSIYVPPEDKVVFVIRIRGIIGISPKVRKILQLLRLRQLHNGVFVRINAATTKMLRLVEPFIAYGYPNLKSVKEWQEYSKSSDRPKDIPSHPDQTYKKNGWKGWPDFLGIDRIANGKRVYKNFEEAKVYARNLNIKGQKEWFEFCKSGNKPDDIPSHPNSKYKISGWLDWSDFLGTKSKNKRNREYKSFREAIEFVHGLKLKNQNEWFSYGKSGNKPEEIPLYPSTVYKDKGWINWGDWLGTLTIATQFKEFQSFENAREYARSLKLSGNLKWMKHLKENNINNYPRNPAKTYKDKGWKDWEDFLGKK
jgi:ribosomal protein L30/L7E